MDEMEYLCKMIVAIVKAEEDFRNKTMTKDDNINIGFNFKNRKYNVEITVEEANNE